MADNVVLTVTMLNKYVKSLLDGDINLQSVYVKGEISNFKANFSSGHFYFTLKDKNAAVRAVMFKWQNQRLKFMPEDGMSIIARGKVSLYESGGEYQFVLDDMQPDGFGALAIAYEQLKNKLEKEGLFDKNIKKPIPRFPNKVCVITSESGAAVRDIFNVIGRRYPLCEVVLIPVSVQGENAAPEISKAIKYASDNNLADVIITGRGGGSIEDLWAFNEEIVARAVYECKIPVISAVGHETDFTICDFVADLRAPTPSAAAELAVPDIIDLRDYFLGYSKFIDSFTSNYINNQLNLLSNISLLLDAHSPANYIENLKIRLDSATKSINNYTKAYFDRQVHILETNVNKLNSYNPIAVLKRGYSAVIKDGKTVASVTSIQKGDKLDVRMSDGTIKCEVIN